MSSERHRNAPKIAIVTVCRNEAEGIRKTAESVAGQTCRDFEWIVKDGGSTDGTLEALAEYRVRMAHFETGSDGGVYDAMNRGAARASGEWLLFLNGGDALADRTALERALPHLPEGGVGIRVGGCRCVWPDGREPEAKANAGVLGRDHFWQRTINHQSAFIGRETFGRFGPYDTTFKLLADYDFFVRAVLGGEEVRCIPGLVAEYDMSGISAARKGTEEMRRERGRIRAQFPAGYRVRRWLDGAARRLAGSGGA